MESNKFGLEEVRYSSDGDVRTELKRRASDGRYYPFLCHIQSREGKGIMSNSHVHNVIELIYCLEGAADFFLGTRKYILKKDELLLINSGETHRADSISSGVTKYIVVQFEPDILRAGGEFNMGAKYIMPFRISSAENRRVFNCDEFGKEYIGEIIFDIVKEYENKEYGFELAIRANICRLFLQILRVWQAEGLDSPRSESSERTMEKIFAYVEQNYDGEIFAEDAAKISGMSYSYFSRYFKRNSGMSFTQYLNSVRIDKAEDLLACSEKSITEIAMEVGFSSTSYFIARFKAQKQMSPGDFRRRLAKS